jgi:oligopeptide transport system substrate-binding protein
MKLQMILGAAFAATLLGSTAMTFAAEVPAGTTLAAEQVFKYRVLDNINSLDPQIVEDVDTSAVVRSLFEGLYNSGADGKPVPGAAESYTVNDDFTVYTFKLRDAKWSNGEPVTAGDFVFGWQRAVDPATASPYAYFVGLVNVANADDIVAGTKPVTDLGVKAIDDKTLEVTLNAPTPWFIGTLAHATLYPAPKAVVEAAGADWTKPENIVGNGAYILAENTPGERVVIKRNPNYWDNAKTVLEEVQFLTINDENQGLTRWRAGEVDQTDVPVGQYPTLEAELPDQTHSVPQFCTYYFNINMTDTAAEPLKDVRVREALSLAVDRDVLVNNVLQGGQTPAYSFVNPYTAGYSSPELPIAMMTQAERDAKAVELMTAAGYGPSNPLTFEYVYNTSEAHKQIATVVGQMWTEKLGVSLTLQDMEFATLLDMRHEQAYSGLARNAWCGDYNEASTFLGLYESTSDANDSGWSNAEVDKLLADASMASDPNPMYAQVEQIAATEVPIIPVYFYAKVFMQNTNVKGWPFENVEQTWYAKDMYKVAE